MKCIILSPKKESRKAIETVVKQNKFLEIVKSCGSVGEAKDVLLKHKADIVFIEIEKPGMDGYSALDETPNGRPHRIFISSKKELAKDAFDNDGADFILMPVTQMSLVRALGKVMKPKRNTLDGADNDGFVFFKTNKAIWKVAVKDIQYIEALADYVNIYTTAKRYIVHSTMKAMLSRLPATDFIRVHKSFIVCLDKITKIEGRAVIVDKKSIPLSRAYRKELIEKINFLH